MQYSPNRLEKGFSFEGETVKGLDTVKARFKANPRDFEAWKKNVEHGADIILPFAEVECKFLKSKVYPSWIRRDYIPRFHNPNVDRIIVTNWKWFIPKDCRILLYQHDIKVMNREEFLWYVINKLRRRNKYCYSIYVIDKYLNDYVAHFNGVVFKSLDDFG